jgi:hypothetical protein
MRSLSLCYLHGLGVEKDTVEGLALHARSSS